MGIVAAMRIIKNFLCHYPRFNQNRLIERLSSHEYVSFDIFDTLIKRCVSTPPDVFIVAAKQFCNEIDLSFDVEKWKQDRVQAECNARVLAESSGREEVLFEEIYKQLPSCYSPYHNCLMDAEIAAEKMCCHRNPLMWEVFQWAKEAGKHIVLVSDMYLPQTVIEDILAQCGYNGHEKLYVSSEVGKTKSTGSLFEHVLSDLNITPEQLIHIGDGIRGDYLSARVRHIHAVNIARNPNQTLFTRLRKMKLEIRRQYEPVVTVMNGYIKPNWDIYHQFGFEVLGPILYGFCVWLHNSVKERGIKHIFFLSRDGYLMQKGYRLLYGNEEIPNTYLYVSRHALYNAQMWMHPEFEEVIETYRKTRRIWDCTSFCEKIGVDIDSGQRAWDTCGLGEIVYLDGIDEERDKKLRQFYCLVKEGAVKKSYASFSLLVQYLEQNDFSGSIAIADIGWAGSMQSYLQKIISYLPNPVQLYGYYVGLTEDSTIVGSAESYIPPEVIPQAGLAGMWELCFCSQEGSTKAYQYDKAGVMQPVLFPSGIPDAEQKNRIQQLQTGALEFVNIAKRSSGLMPFESKIMSASFLIAGRNPRHIETSMFGDFLFFDTHMIPLAKPRKAIDYIKAPSQLKRDFAESCWKLGFMKRLFRISFPYWMIFKGIKTKITNKVRHK